MYSDTNLENKRLINVGCSVSQPKSSYGRAGKQGYYLVLVQTELQGCSWKAGILLGPRPDRVPGMQLIMHE